MPHKWIRPEVHRAIAVGLAVMFALGGLASVRAQGNYDVVILVVDDFGTVDLADVDASDFGSNENCAVSLEGQAYAVRDFSSGEIPSSHGDLVFEQIENLVDDANAASYIDLVEVDIQGQSTDVVASRIEDAIDDNPADFYVVNMSFGVIPCEYIEAFASYDMDLMSAREAKNLNSYRSLFNRAVVFYDNTVFPVMSQKAQSASNLDPLQATLDSLGTSVIPVAAAGNFGLDFPFWPGAWGQVISVSASNGHGYYASAAWDSRRDTPLLTAEAENSGQQKRISNYGEVMLPGEFASDDGDVSGTSFAAPRLSVAFALYVSAVGNNYCRDSDGNPALAYGDWDNLTLDDAVAGYCPNMASYLP